MNFILDWLKLYLEPLANRLAVFLDKTKASSPLIWLLIVTVTIAANFIASNCSIIGICDNEYAQIVFQFIGYLVLSVTGSRTYMRTQKVLEQEKK